MLTNSNELANVNEMANINTMSTYNQNDFWLNARASGLMLNYKWSRRARVKRRLLKHHKELLSILTSSEVGDDIRIIYVDTSESDANITVQITSPVDAVIKVDWSHNCDINVYSPDFETGDKLCEKTTGLIRQLTSNDVNIDEDSVPFTFWYAGQNGFRSNVRAVGCPRWESIKNNYEPDVAQAFEAISAISNPHDYGKVILWHGIPGSGKTHLVRALAREWFGRFNTSVEVIIDHERLFENIDYMHHVLLDSSYEDTSEEVSCIRDEMGLDGEAKPNARLFIVEDGAALFSKDCRDRSGFMRLLNVADGIIGQGIRAVFLLTANEELGRIDDAVMRPGRCLQHLQFKPLDKSFSCNWLAEKGVAFDANSIGEQLSLADLYTHVNKQPNPVAGNTTNHKLGF